MTRRAGGEIIIKSDTSQAAAEMSKFEKNIKNFQKTTVALGKGLTKYVSLPLLGIGAAAVKSAMDFENQMARVASISGAVGGELELLEKVSREMGETTTFSASEAAKGMEYLAMAGWEVHEMAAGLPAVLKMAEAVQMDLGTAADITSDMMSAFRLKAEEASRVTDVLTKASFSANTNVEMLGETMKYAAPAAAAAGVSIEQTAAMAGLLADAGIKGSMAGTTLNMMLADLTSMSDKAAKEAKELGVSVFDAEGNMRDIADIIEDVEKATKGMTDEQRSAFLGMIFGQRAIRGVNILLGIGSEEIRDFTGELENAEGTVEKAGETMQETLAYQLEQLKSAVVGLAIDLGNELIPIIKDEVLPVVNQFVDWLKNLLDAFSRLRPETRRLIIGFAGLLIALGPVLMMVSKLAGAILTLSKAKAALSAAMAASAGKAGLLAKVMIALKAVITALSGPIGWILLAVAAVGAAFVAFRLRAKNAVDQFEQETREAFDRVSTEALRKTMEQVQGIIGEYERLADEGSWYFQKLYLRQEEITKDGWKEIESELERQKKEHLWVLKEQEEEELKTVQEMYDREIIQSELHAETLQKSIIEDYAERSTLVEEGFAEIHAIAEREWEEHGKITKEGMQEIQKIQREMHQEEIKIMREAAMDMTAIRVELFRNRGNIDQEQYEAAKERLEEHEKEQYAILDEALEEDLRLVNMFHAQRGTLGSEAHERDIEALYNRYEKDKKIVFQAHRHIEKDYEAYYKNLDTTGKTWYPVVTKGLTAPFSVAYREINGILIKLDSRVQKAMGTMSKNLIDNWMYTSRELVGNSIIPDMADDIAEEFESLNRRIGEKTKKIREQTVEVFDVGAGAVRTELSRSFRTAPLAAERNGAPRQEQAERREYVFTIPLIVNGREIARASANYTDEELERLKQTKLRMGGVVV